MHYSTTTLSESAAAAVQFVEQGLFVRAAAAAVRRNLSEKLLIAAEFIVELGRNERAASSTQHFDG